MEPKPTPKPSKTGRLSGAGRKGKRLITRFPLLFAALVLAVAMISGSLAYATNKKDVAANGGFDTSKVLPQAVTIPPSSPNKEFTADTIKQYDGKEGRKCYVAVKGVVYEIASKGQWQEGQHSPSSGQAYCGADLSDTIGKSPHGSSKLEELPVVGTYK